MAVGVKTITKKTIRAKYRTCLALEELYRQKLKIIMQEKKRWKKEINKWDTKDQWW